MKTIKRENLPSLPEQVCSNLKLSGMVSPILNKQIRFNVMKTCNTLSVYETEVYKTYELRFDALRCLGFGWDYSFNLVYGV